MKRFFSILLILCLLLALSGCLEGPEPPAAPAPVVGDGTGLAVHFIDVGQADAALVLCGGEAMLIDGGNVDDGSTVVSYLADCGVAMLDYVVCTHAHEDHVGGLAGVLAAYPAETVLCPMAEYDTKAFRDFVKYAEARDLTLTVPEPDSSFALGDAAVTVLAPRAAYDDANDTSIVLRIDYGGTAFLFTGDAERASEEDMLNAGCDVACTVLKVGHHGSSSSTSYRFLYESDPEYAVISCGKDNDYGHPHEEVMSRLHDAAVTVYRTDLQGHIVCYSDGQSVSFETKRNSGADTNPQPTIDPAEASTVYIGNVNSKKFHRESCSGLPKEENRIYFDSRAAAVDAGYEPCKTCMGG
jgi:competence protein ComEC